jgi:alcohol dehydrogenase
MLDGGMAEYCLVSADQLVAMPDGVSFAEAASLPVAYGTAHRMLITHNTIRQGDRVLVLGASGGVGTGCVILAKLLGAEVIACASSEDKLARLKELGADHGIDYSNEDFVKWIYSKFGKPHRRSFEGGVDVVVNFTGGATWVPSLKTLHRQGRILTCGATAGFDPKEDLRFIWTYELNIRGSNGWMREDLTALLNLLDSGKLKPIIDRELSLADTNEGFRLLEDRLVFGKVIMKP